MEFDLPKEQSSIIKVIGVGGGGSNAVNHMYNQGIKGVDFLICNTDAQALEISPVPNKIQLGTALTEGRGAGSIPEVGMNAAVENIDELKEILSKNTKMVFITAGMGGGTGTGAAPIIAQAAKELGILTVGIVTFPFTFEGKKRRLQAEAGLEELREHVDTLLIINNDKLREMYGNLSLANAFTKADDILATAAKGIAEIITVTGYINVDFEDVKTVMTESGPAIMGSATAQGEGRALLAVEEALASPLLNDSNIKGANYILLYITSGADEVLMDEIAEITDYIQDEAGSTADIIWGTGSDESLGDSISVTLVATGFESSNEIVTEKRSGKKEDKVVHSLDDSVPQTNLEAEKEVIASTPNPRPVVEPKSGPVTYDLNNDTFPHTSASEVFNRQNISHTVNPNGFNAPTEKSEAPVTKYNLFEEEASTEVNDSEISNNLNETPNTPVVNEVRNDIQLEDESLKEKEFSAEEQLRKSQERIMRLKSLSMKMNTPSGINELENVPAYQRKNVQLNDVPHSSDSTESRYTLSQGEDNKTEIRPNNSFLHDNVD